MILRLRSGSVTPLEPRRNRFVAFSYCNFMCRFGRRLPARLPPRAREQTVVDENAGEMVADGLVQQRRRHARIHAAAQAENHLVISYLFADFLDGLVDKRPHRPVFAAAAKVMHKVGNDLLPIGRVDDFGMKLQAEEFRARFSIAAYSEFSVTATDLKPFGIFVSLSPCEFQTFCGNQFWQTTENLP